MNLHSFVSVANEGMTFDIKTLAENDTSSFDMCCCFMIIFMRVKFIRYDVFVKNNNRSLFKI